MTRALALAAVLLSGAAWGQSTDADLPWRQGGDNPSFAPPGGCEVGYHQRTIVEGQPECVRDDGPGVSRPHAPTNDPTLDHVLGECDGARWAVVEWGTDGKRTDSYTWLEPLRPLCLWAEGQWALKQGMPK
jgi:hypothetical protein